MQNHEDLMFTRKIQAISSFEGNLQEHAKLKLSYNTGQQSLTINAHHETKIESQDQGDHMHLLGFILKLEDQEIRQANNLVLKKYELYREHNNIHKYPKLQY